MSQPHSWVHWPLVSRQRCKYCGLLWLRNALSDLWAKKPCKWWDE